MKEVISRIRDVSGIEPQSRAFAMDQVIEKRCENIHLGPKAKHELPKVEREEVIRFENRLLQQEKNEALMETAIEANRGLQKELGIRKGIDHNY